MSDAPWYDNDMVDDNYTPRDDLAVKAVGRKLWFKVFIIAEAVAIMVAVWAVIGFWR